MRDEITHMGYQEHFLSSSPIEKRKFPNGYSLHFHTPEFLY